MASSLPYDPFKNEACLPCLSTAGDGQSEDQQQGAQKLAPTVRETISHHQDNRTLEMKRTEDLLASELHKLSLEERNRALDDVHCVGEQLKETPEMVQKSLSDFDQVVRKARNPIYELAISQNRTYVEDPTFRLKFLRANLHHVDKSVHQMMQFLQNKAKYFGQDKVTREIGLSDLTDEDITVMLSGVNHIQEERDRMGRPIVHHFEKFLGGYSAATANRVAYYFWWNIIIANPDAQLKGVAGIYHSIFRIPDDIGFIRETMSFFNSIPLRFSALHYCLQTSLWRSLGSNGALHSLILTAMPRYARVRSRIHHGSSMEIQYQLRGHGIPVDTFPVDVDGNIREAIINLWFQKHLVDTNQIAVFQRTTEVAQIPPEDILMDVDFGLSEQESLSYWNENGSREVLLEPVQFSTQMWSSSANRVNPESRGVDQAGIMVGVEAGIVTVSKIDVLFGKGYRVQLHPGNIRFREFLQQHRAEYENVPRSHRREVCCRLAVTLRNSGVRFLQKAESGEWVENNNMEEVENKIGQMFREYRKKEQRESSAT